MKIYSFPTFNLTKVLLTAEELGLDYEFHLLDITKGEHKTEDHYARHPLGKVPAIEYEGQYYIESNSICRLLAETNNNRLYANDPKQRAIINQWIDLVTSHIGRWMSVFFFEEMIKPNLLDGQPEPSEIEEAAAFLKEQLPVMEQALTRSDYLTGTALTIADIIAFSYCQVHEYTSLDFQPYPKLTQWYHSIKNRPAFARAMQHSPTGEMLPFAR